MKLRELRPALTHDEIVQRDLVFDHATRTGIRKGENQKVKVHVRCNQPASDNASICPWEEWFDVRAADAEITAKRKIAGHIRTSHPSLNARRIAGRSWVSLADAGG